MAKKIRKSVKISIISIVVAVAVVCATVLAVILFKDKPNFLTTSQKAFFNALHAQNTYSSDLDSSQINLGSAEFDSIVAVYDGYALVKSGNEYKILSMKAGYEGQEVNIQFDAVLSIKNDIVIVENGDTFSGVKITYPNSSTIDETTFFSGASEAKMTGDILSFYYASTKTLKIVRVGDGEELLEKTNVVDYSVNATGVTMTSIEVLSEAATATTSVLLYKNNGLETYKEFQTAVSVSQAETQYLISGKYISLDNFVLARLSGRYLLVQNFSSVDEAGATCIIGSKPYNLSQTLYSLDSGKSISLSNALYFDSIKSGVEGYVSVIGDEIKSDKSIDFDQRIVYYYDNQFELLLSYDYDEFGDLIDYKKDLAITKRGFIDVLGNGKLELNTKLKENKINEVILSSDPNVVFARNASSVYVVNISDSKVTRIADKGATFVDEFMLVSSIAGANSEYYLVNNSGVKTKLENIATDGDFATYNALSTGYYIQNVNENSVRIVKYDGSVLVDNVNKNAVSYNLTSDRKTILLSVVNTSGKYVLASKLPNGAILPSSIDSVVMFGFGARMADPVAMPQSATASVPSTSMGDSYNMNNNSDPFFVTSSGSNISVATYYKYLLQAVTIRQYNQILDVTIDVDTEIVYEDLKIDNVEYGGIGINKIDIAKVTNDEGDYRSYYNAEVSYIERARIVNYKVENNGVVTSVSEKIWYADVHAGNTNSYIPESKRTGYIFTGYVYNNGTEDYVVTTGTTLSLDAAIVETIMPVNSFSMTDADLSQTFTFTPKFKAIDYTVTFNANASGVSGSVGDIAATYDVNSLLPSEVYTRTGYRHIGWTTVEGGTVVEFEKGATVKNLTAENGATVTLYAVWAENTYNVVFDANITGGTAYNRDGSVYAPVSRAITINNQTLSAPNIYVKLDNGEYKRFKNWYFDQATTNVLSIDNFFFGFVDSGNTFVDSERLDVADNQGYVFKVDVYAAYESLEATFGYAYTFNSNGVDAANYKAFKPLVTGTAYEEITPITSMSCGGVSSDVSAKTGSYVLGGIAYGDNVSFAISFNGSAVYVRNLSLTFYVDTTAYTVTIVGDNVTNPDENLVSVDYSSGSILITMKNVKPKFVSDSYTLGSVSVDLGLKEFAVVSSLNGIAQTINYPEMQIETDNNSSNGYEYLYNYSSNIYYGRTYTTTIKAPSGHVFDTFSINGIAQEFEFKYTSPRNDLYLKGLTPTDSSLTSSTYYRVYNIDGCIVKIGFDGNYYIEVSGQVTKDLAFVATSKKVTSNVTITATNATAGGASDAITFSGVQSTIDADKNFTATYTIKNGFRVKQINVKYNTTTVDGFRSYNYSFWNKDTGYYGGYSYNDLKGTSVNTTQESNYSITIKNVWFDIEVEVVYERVFEIVVNIDNLSNVEITDQDGNDITTLDTLDSANKIRIIGHEDIETVILKTKDTGNVYYISSAAIPVRMQDYYNQTEKVSAAWDSYNASYVEFTIDSYEVEFAIESYLGVGDGNYVKEHEVTGTYYTKDYITFIYDEVEKKYGSLDVAESATAITMKGRTLTINLQDTNGIYKGYLAGKFVVVRGGVESETAGKELVFTLSDTEIGGTDNRFTIRIYFDPIVYYVDYVAGDFSGITADSGNTTLGSVNRTTHVFNVEQSVAAPGFTRQGWKQTGWTYKADALTAAGKAADIIPTKNLSNVNEAVVTLYAAWEVKTYNIIYNDNKGEGSSTPSVVEKDGNELIGDESIRYLETFDENALKVIERNGYAFLGWYTASDADGAKLTNQMFGYELYEHLKRFNSIVDDDANEIWTITLSAQWKFVKYTLTKDNFIFNDATENGSTTAELVKEGIFAGYASDLSDYTYSISFDTDFGVLPKLKRVGYKFVGWSTALTGGTMITPTTTLNDALFNTLIGDKKNEKEGASFNLYAMWEKQALTVIFSNNIGNGLPGYNLPDDNGFTDPNPATKTIYFDGQIGELPEPPSASGYEFVGWYFKPGFDYDNITPETEASKITSSTIISVSNWGDLQAVKGTSLSSIYVVGDNKNDYSFTLFAYWKIKSYTVKAATGGSEYVNSASNNSGFEDVEKLDKGSASTKTLNYGDFAVIDFIPQAGNYIKTITFKYNGTTWTYTLNWNSVDQTMELGSPSSTFNKINFVEGVKFIISSYDDANDSNNVRIVLTFVKTDIEIVASEESQVYLVTFKQGSNTLFTTLVEYKNAIDDRLFVYPYKKGYKFTGFELTNKSGTLPATDSLIEYDTTVTLKYIESSSVQKVNFYFWNQVTGAYVKNDTISAGYNLESNTFNGINYNIDQTLTPIIDEVNGTSVVMGESGPAQKVSGFTYGGVLLALPAKNNSNWPSGTELAGYVIADGAPASGTYYTQNVSGQNSITNKFELSYMIEEEINLYAIYNDPAFKFIGDDEISDVYEFSVDGYNVSDVQYLYISATDLGMLKEMFATNENLPAALQTLINSGVTTGNIKVAYLLATENGNEYIYRVADTYWNTSTNTAHELSST